MNEEVDKFKCSLGAHQFQILKINKKLEIDDDLEIKICKVCGKILEEDNDIKWDVAYNPNTPPEILVKLSKDENWFVREEVAGNLKTPIEILEKLSKDEDRMVRRRAKINLKNRK